MDDFERKTKVQLYRKDCSILYYTLTFIFYLYELSIVFLHYVHISTYIYIEDITALNSSKST